MRPDLINCRRWARLAVAVCAALGAGCAGESATPSGASSIGERGEAIQPAELPDVRGCADVRLPAAQVSVRAVAGVRDLYLVLAGHSALCIDSADGVRQLAMLIAANPRSRLLSDPMPGNVDAPAGSDPMPGQPGDPSTTSTTTPSGSDPMPGQPGDPTAVAVAMPSGSDPMPGNHK